MFDRYGTLNSAEGRPSLHFERLLAHPRQRVWRAITDSDELRRWFPADLQGERTPGAAIRITSFTGRFAPSAGRFIACEPCVLLEYTWGNELLRWELQVDKAGCVLAFTNFLDDNAVDIGIANIASAWHACFDVLDFVLAEENPPYTTDDRFAQISPDYVDRMGHENGDT